MGLIYATVAAGKANAVGGRKLCHVRNYEECLGREEGLLAPGMDCDVCVLWD